MTGRMSMEQAKTVKQKRELAQELGVLNLESDVVYADDRIFAFFSGRTAVRKKCVGQTIPKSNHCQGGCGWGRWLWKRQRKWLRRGRQSRWTTKETTSKPCVFMHPSLLWFTKPIQTNARKSIMAFLQDQSDEEWRYLLIDRINKKNVLVPIWLLYYSYIYKFGSAHIVAKGVRRKVFHFTSLREHTISKPWSFKSPWNGCVRVITLCWSLQAPAAIDDINILLY